MHLAGCSARRAARPAILAVVALGFTFGGARATLADDSKPDNNKDLGKALDTMLDEAAPAAERIKAIQGAGGLSAIGTLSGRKDEYRKALDTMLRSLGAKQPRTADQEKVAAKGFECMTTHFRIEAGGFPELAKLVKPFFANPAANDTRISACGAIEKCGAPGVGADLAKFFDQPYAKGKASKDKEREKLEPRIVFCTRGLPGNEALDVLAVAVTKSGFSQVKKRAIEATGEFVLRRKARDYDQGRVVNMLKEVAKTKGVDWEIGDAAAVALLRHNSFEGMPAVFERLTGKVPQKTTYGAVCLAAHKADGFMGVTVDSFDETQGQPREDAIAAAKDWWNTAQKETPESVIAAALGPEGVNLPKDRASRDYVSGLIEGLKVRDFALRSAVLDLLTQKIARPDFAYKFNRLHEDAGGPTVKINIESGIDASLLQDKAKLAQLMAQQDEKANKLKAAWDEVKDKATYEGGVWNVPWKPEPGEAAKPGSAKPK